MLFRLFVILFLLVYALADTTAQNENRVWILGNNIGLDFNPVGQTGPGPSVQVNSFFNSSINQSFSNKSAVADTLGNLLFYTDGKRIFNKEFEVMENGDRMLKVLDGNVSKTHIVKGSCGIYYVIFLATVSDFTASIHYTKIDMNANDGLGKVDNVERGIALRSGSVKAIASASGFGKTWVAIYDSNKDVGGRIILFSLEKDTFKFERSHDLNLEDVFTISAKMKFSPDGTRLCIIQENFLRHATPMFYYSFDPENGDLALVSKYNPLDRYKGTFNTNTIAAEFAPNMKYLYIIERYGLCDTPPPCKAAYRLYQIELDRNKNIRLTTKYELAFVAEFTSKAMNDLQMSPGGIIFVNRIDTNAIDAVLSPNLRRDKSLYRQGYVEWQSGFTALSLPSQVLPEEQLLRVKGPLDSLILCKDQSLELGIDEFYDRVKWYDGDTSFTKSFNEAGEYMVTLYQGNCKYEEEYQISDVQELPGLLPADTSFCEDQEILSITLNGEFESILWDDGDSAINKSFKEEGFHRVEVTKNGCAFRDSFELRQVRLPSDYLPTDTFICERGALFLTVPHNGAFYQWSTGETSRSIRVNDPGNYSVFVQDGKCQNSDEINVVLSEKYQLIDDSVTIICKGDEVDLNFNQEVVWYSGLNRPRGSDFTFSEEDIYVFEYKNELCTFYDTLNLVEKLCIEAELYVANIFSPNNDGENDFLSIGLNKGIEFHGGNWAIYDRYGSIMWSSEDIDERWDGTFNGNPIPMGVYTLVADLDITDTFGRRRYVTASDVTLIR